MMILVTYDISVSGTSGAKRLRRVAKECLDYGVRVQNSVFECDVEPAQWVKLKSNLLKIYDEEQDSLRFYMLGSNWRIKVEHYGAKQAVDVFRDILII
ncbi:CRISPR-associated endonuclease Cas2 [Fluoribacter gormanii]|uniref:CRISPR-associated endonuclease Cas2 n=1 Tax=Fluoribacter gormanii TaxID=464 RepID=UPI0007777C32|nr:MULTISPECIES: CRISPR-associated endonuclease Cas2 [Legionellaceae]MCW8469384.1 CRISPR-associated endonuclease Cas2 [Fluoribacter gormanii]HAT1766737.1 CRISPR-associated endonuclease Cas2 [Legionella pneumophila]HAT8591682.1 CRISPR-associated endonuclease Cas2 [Legionella pneumophila]